MEPYTRNGGMIGVTMDLGSTDRYITGQPLDITYITLVQENAPGTTSHTFTSVDTSGLTSADTLVVVFHAEVTAVSTPSPVTSISVDGNSATLDGISPTSSPVTNIGIIAVAHISGITADSVDITVTYPSQSILRAAAATYIVPGITSLTVIDTDEYVFGGSSSSETLTTNIENGGLVVYALSTGDENDTASWSNATETYDVPASENNSQWTGAFLEPTTTKNDYIETITLSGATQNGAGLAISYAGNVSEGNLKNSGIWDLYAVYENKIFDNVTSISVLDAQVVDSATSPTPSSMTIPSTSQVGDLVVILNTSVNISGGGLPTLVTNESDGFTVVVSAEAERARSIISYKVIESSDINKTITGLTGTNAARYSYVVYRPDVPITGMSINNTYKEEKIDSLSLTTPVNISPNLTGKFTIAVASLQTQNTSALSITGIDSETVTPNVFNYYVYGTSNSQNQTMTYSVTSQSGTYRIAAIAFLDINNSQGSS